MFKKYEDKNVLKMVLFTKDLLLPALAPNNRG